MNNAEQAISNKFIKAVNYACELHSQHFRKGGKKPYIAHLLGTASIAYEYGATETEAIAALLHDAIEDQGGLETENEIRRRFGPEITDIVKGCSDSKGEPKPPWQERKTRYIEHLETASPSVHLVSASDKLYNARAILQDYRLMGDELWSRFNAKKEDTIWYYRSLANAFLHYQKTNTELLRELDRVVRKIEKMTTDE